LVLPFRRRGSRIAERDIFAKLATHIELSAKAATIVSNELRSGISRHEVESLAAEVAALEKRGDELAAEITKDLGKSTIPLTMHGEIERLLDLVDDILDDLYFISQEVARGRRNGLDANPIVEKLYQDLAAMSSVARVAIERLRELIMIVGKDFRRARELNVEIDFYEDRIDEMRNEVLNKVYSSRHDLDPLAMYHIIEIARAIDRVVDTCKDASHIILSALSSMVS